MKRVFKIISSKLSKTFLILFSIMTFLHYFANENKNMFKRESWIDMFDHQYNYTTNKDNTIAYFYHFNVFLKIR